MRYRLYRVHKYVCFELAEFDRAAARTDFSDPTSRLALLEIVWEKLSDNYKQLIICYSQNNLTHGVSNG